MKERSEDRQESKTFFWEKRARFQSKNDSAISRTVVVDPGGQFLRNSTEPVPIKARRRAMKFRAFALAGALMVTSHQANAFTSVDALRQACTSAKTEAVLACLSYLNGYIHGYIAGQKYQKNACITASSELITRQFLKFTDERPELWGHPAQWAVAGFLERAYPC
jgi:hypothetical protein